MKISLRSRVGLGLALFGGVLMVLGGIGDLTIRHLLPSHQAFLGVGPDDIPPATETLVLALLHALGTALVAGGLAVLVLLRQAWITGRRLPALTAVAVALLAEGMNAAGIYKIGSPLFVAPLTFLLLVLVGVTMCFLPRWELGVPAMQRESVGSTALTSR